MGGRGPGPEEETGWEEEAAEDHGREASFGGGGTGGESVGKGCFGVVGVEEAAEDDPEGY